MKPNHFRVYAQKETISRRDTPEGKMNLAHDVHDVVAEGALKDGVASFDAKDAAYVVFYGGKGDEQTVLGRLEGPFADGKADFADVPIEEPVTAEGGQVVADGVTYRKV